MSSQHMPLDKAYDNPTGKGPRPQPDTPRTSAGSARKEGLRPIAGHKPRRWVIERTSWLSKCRGILVRYEKKDIDYLALI